jgi:hypothetical protein
MMEARFAPGFWILFPLSLLYIALLLRLGAYRRDRKNPSAWWGPPEDIRTFLSRDTYEERGHILLLWVRIVLIMDLALLAWMFLSPSRGS